MGGPTQQPNPGDLGDLIWILQIPSHTARVPSPASVAADLARVPSPGTAAPAAARSPCTAGQSPDPHRARRALSFYHGGGPVARATPKKRGAPQGALPGGSQRGP